MSRVLLRPARRSDFEALCGAPPCWRVRAFTAERDGTLLGIGGLVRLPAAVDGSIWGAFLELAPDARRYPVALHKAGLRTIEEARRLRISRLVALADPGIAPAERWLRRLGFRPERAGDRKIWAWTPRRDALPQAAVKPCTTSPLSPGNPALEPFARPRNQ